MELAKRSADRFEGKLVSAVATIRQAIILGLASCTHCAGHLWPEGQIASFYWWLFFSCIFSKRSSITVSKVQSHLCQGGIRGKIYQSLCGNSSRASACFFFSHSFVHSYIRYVQGVCSKFTASPCRWQAPPRAHRRY